MPSAFNVDQKRIPVMEGFIIIGVVATLAAAVIAQQSAEVARHEASLHQQSVLEEIMESAPAAAEDQYYEEL